ncbi:MAG: rhodanese-like protein [Chitinophagaceae bacterium]|nr:rhodanese-like protein [Chitinophagaceae bacterium]
MKNITVQELNTKIQNGEKLVLLDVREDHERTEFNIGGIHIPLGKVQTFQLEDIEEHKEDEVVVYCRSGRRSMMAGMMLEQVGFKDVANLEGGMLAWQEAKL